MIFGEIYRPIRGRIDWPAEIKPKSDRLLDRCVSADNKDSCEGYLANILTYYKYNGAFTVQDTDDFVRQISAMVRKSDGAKIKTLVIGSHGRDGRDGYFRIGITVPALPKRDQ